MIKHKNGIANFSISNAVFIWIGMYEHLQTT